MPAQLQDLERRLDDVAWQRNNVRDLQQDKRRLPALEEQVSALQAQMSALQTSLATLPARLRTAEQELEAASQRRQRAFAQHWQWIETQRTPEEWDLFLEGEADVLFWLSAVDRHYSSGVAGDPPAPSEALLRRYGSWGGLYQRRDQLKERLLAAYPFAEESQHG